MDLKHTFTVPAGIDETWSHFQDIESVAGCFPGATVTEVGTVKRWVRSISRPPPTARHVG